MICPDTSETSVVRVRGSTTPWERTTKITGCRCATATSTSRVGGGAGFCTVGGRAPASNSALTPAPPRTTIGRRIFSSSLYMLVRAGGKCYFS